MGAKERAAKHNLVCLNDHPSPPTTKSIKAAKNFIYLMRKGLVVINNEK